jgi:hypothetical protein
MFAEMNFAEFSSGPCPDHHQGVLSSHHDIDNTHSKTIITILMSDDLHKVWEASASTPYQPLVSKDLQAVFGFLLLITGLCSGLTASLIVQLSFLRESLR